MSARGKAVQGSNQRARAVGIPGLQAGEDVNFHRDMKHYRAPEEPVVLKNVVTAIAILEFHEY